MFNLLKTIFSKKQKQGSKPIDIFTICQGKKYEVLKRIDPETGIVEIIIKDRKTSSEAFSKVLSDWYIDNSNFPEAILTADEKLLVICGYYYNPIIIVDIERAILYWQINQFKDIYEFVVNGDQIKIKDCTDEEDQVFQYWKIDINNKKISEIKDRPIEFE